MRGDLSDSSVVDLCRGLADAEATGSVVITSDGEEGRIYFRSGRVYWAMSPAPRARLGDRLVNAALLTAEQLEHALDVQSRSDQHVKLGALLVEQGVVSRDAIRVFVQEQILDAIFDLIRWSDGGYEFLAGEASEERLPIDIPVPEMLVEVSRREQEWGQIEADIPDLDAIPDFVIGGSSASAALEPDEFAVLASVDGRRSIRDLADHLGYSEFEAARIVYGLTLLGIIEVVPDDEDDLEPVEEAAPVDDVGLLEEALGLTAASTGAAEEVEPPPSAEPPIEWEPPVEAGSYEVSTYEVSTYEVHERAAIDDDTHVEVSTHETYERAAVAEETDSATGWEPDQPPPAAWEDDVLRAADELAPSEDEATAEVGVEYDDSTRWILEEEPIEPGASPEQDTTGPDPWDPGTYAAEPDPWDTDGGATEAGTQSPGDEPDLWVAPADTEAEPQDDWDIGARADQPSERGSEQPQTEAGATAERGRELDPDEFDRLINSLAGGTDPDPTKPSYTSTSTSSGTEADETPEERPHPDEPGAPPRQGGDVSEFLRELSRLALNEARGGQDEAGDASEQEPDGPPEPADSTVLPPPRPSSRPSADDSRDEKKKRGLFGWGR